MSTPPRGEIAGAVQEGDHHHTAWLHSIQQAISEDEDLADIRIPDLRDHAASLGELGETRRGRQRGVENVPGCLPGVLRDVGDDFVQLPDEPIQPRLRCGPEEPFPPKLCRDLFVRNDEARVGLIKAAPDCLDNVEMVEHVVKAAIVWQPIE